MTDLRPAEESREPWPCDAQHITAAWLDDDFYASDHSVAATHFEIRDDNASHQAAALQLVHALLLGTRPAESDLREQRIGAVMREIQSQFVRAAEDSVAPALPEIVGSPRRMRNWLYWSGAAALLTTTMLALLTFIGQTPASAAAGELNRIIAANAQTVDRTYQIAVEASLSPTRRGNRPAELERSRPPKPPMDGAILHIRGNRQFVLVRKTASGLPFITGSNGKTSWAVRPDGPVRVSADLERFNHDVPGHEQAMPLINIQDALERLREAYDIQLQPAEEQRQAAAPAAELQRLIVAVKKRTYRGPERVEITYAIRSGLIQRLRFVDMPYGPERLNLRLTLVDDRPLGDALFDHTTHHGSERTLEFEE